LVRKKKALKVTSQLMSRELQPKRAVLKKGRKVESKI
jgi:hypothetical protein